MVNARKREEVEYYVIRIGIWFTLSVHQSAGIGPRLFPSATPACANRERTFVHYAPLSLFRAAWSTFLVRRAGAVPTRPRHSYPHSGT